MGNISVLFGAGAEFDYGLPSGSDYVMETLCTRKNELYESLRNFYSSRAIDGYAQCRGGGFMFRHNSSAFRRMIESSAQKLLHLDSLSDTDTVFNMQKFYLGEQPTAKYLDRIVNQQNIIDEKIAQLDKKLLSRLSKPGKDFLLRCMYLLAFDNLDVTKDAKIIKESKEFKSILYFELIQGIPVEDKKAIQMQDGWKLQEDWSKYGSESLKLIVALLQKELSYHGVIEKDFSTIVNPREAGEQRFWSLVFYFWSAYFSIFIPLLKIKYYGTAMGEMSDDAVYKKMLEEKGSGTLRLFDEVKSMFEDRSYFADKADEYLRRNNKKSYYNAFRGVFEYALTTNYTPFLQQMEVSAEHCSYLAGKLSQFEYPYELRTVDVTQVDTIIGESDLVIPFIMTQAPIKPIIDSRQIKEYAKAVDYLTNSCTLVVIGYSLCSNDNHVLSLVREFICRKNTHLIFCSYQRKGKKECGIADIENILRLNKQTVYGRIDVVQNNGDPEELSRRIKSILP